MLNEKYKDKCERKLELKVDSRDTIFLYKPRYTMYIHSYVCKIELETKGRKWEKFVGHEDLAYRGLHSKIL